ncbi:hypothetical protein CMI41_02755 [Candidatus Pacearchaeota archaeon]|nr:hypothetical protein [Candidatus Pacearchaeota archaeon]|tara:strand:- start:5272 stop:6288 length:1017 start_codon:yes stop_codon:yes gene_type:complete
MNKENRSLLDIHNKIGRIHIKIDLPYLKKILRKVSSSEIPHRNKNFIEKLGMTINPRTKSCPTMSGWTRGARTIPLGKLIKISKIGNIQWKQIESKIISINSGSRKEGAIKIKFPIKLNKKLGLLVGHILGDGSIDYKYQQVFYSNSNPELLKEFESCMLQLFNIRPRIWMQHTANFEGKTRWERRLNSIEELEKKKNVGLFYPSACGRILNGLFDNFAIGINKEVSLRMMNLNSNFKRGLIRAFYDDEGSIMKNGKCIRLFQDRKDILEAFRIILKEFNIAPGEIKTYIKKDKKRHYFDIHRKSNFIRFKKEIGFTSSKKRNRLNKLCIIKNFKNSK